MEESKLSQWLQGLGLAVIVMDGVFFKFENLRHGLAIVGSIFSG